MLIFLLLFKFVHRKLFLFLKPSQLLFQITLLLFKHLLLHTFYRLQLDQILPNRSRVRRLAA